MGLNVKRPTATTATTVLEVAATSGEAAKKVFNFTCNLTADAAYTLCLAVYAVLRPG